MQLSSDETTNASFPGCAKRFDWFSTELQPGFAVRLVSLTLRYFASLFLALYVLGYKRARGERSSMLDKYVSPLASLVFSFF